MIEMDISFAIFRTQSKKDINFTKNIVNASGATVTTSMQTGSMQLGPGCSHAVHN
jgi:hypothetical protein